MAHPVDAFHTWRWGGHGNQWDMCGFYRGWTYGTPIVGYNPNGFNTGFIGVLTPTLGV